MQVFTDSEASKKLAKVLELADTTGKVIIQRNDGRTYALIPENTSSPLDVPSVKADISTQEIVGVIRESREEKE